MIDKYWCSVCLGDRYKSDTITREPVSVPTEVKGTASVVMFRVRLA